MARYKDYDYRQTELVAISFDEQLLEGTFEYTLAYLVEHCLDFTALDARYANDETGAPAYDPRILLKIVLYAYSRGIVSSREIARACRENVVFMALSANSQPHFTTIAGFISGLDDAARALFRDVLLVCDEEGLIGREMFAVDGVKLPSNASKEWSGTRADFKRKAERTQRAVDALVTRHCSEDAEGAGRRSRSDGERGKGSGAKTERTVARLNGKLAKMREWLDSGQERLGVRGTPRGRDGRLPG